MKLNIRKILLQQILVLICCFSFTANAQLRDITENTEVSLMTCGVGDDLYSLFGHTALRFKDQSQNIDVVFNYGLFDFSTPNFYGKFVKGDLFYNLGVDSYNDFIRYYSYKDRDVTEQKINLTFEQKNKLWLDIWDTYNSDERFYHYKFIENNCTTKVADLINKYSTTKLETNFESNNKTYREILNEYLAMQYLPQLGINVIFGKKVDQTNQLLFLPDQLLKGADLTPNLIKETNVLYKSTVNRFDKISYAKYVFFVLIGILVILSGKKVVRKSYFVVISILGLIMLFLQFYSLHMELLNNPMMGVYNPLYLLLFLLPNKRKIIHLGLLTIGVISLFFMSVEMLLIVFPLLLLHFVMLYRDIK